MPQIAQPSKLLEKLPRVSLYLLVFLLPLWFLPFTQNVLVFQKQFLLIVLVFLGIVAYLGRAVAETEFSFRPSWLYLPLTVLLVMVGVSTLSSSSQYASFWGWPLDVSDSFLTIFAFALFYFLITNVVKDSKQLFSLATCLLISGVLAGVYALLQAYGAFVFPFSFAKDTGFNTIGALNSVALFSAILLPLALVLAFVSKVLLRVFFWILILILFAVVALINFSGAWIVLASGLLVLLVFGIWNLRKRREFGWVSFPMALLVITLFFIFFRFSVPGGPAAQLEVSPSRSSELSIIKEVFQDKTNIFFGSGPGTFSLDYAKFHSPDLNQTAFWGTRFGSGSSEILDFIATKGIMGLLAFLALAALTVISAVKKLGKSQEDSFAWMMNLGYLASLAALLVAFFIYPANFVLWSLFWILAAGAGVAIGKEAKKISLAPPSMWAVASSFLFLIILIFGLGLLFISAQKYLAEVRYLEGAKLASEGKTDQAISKVLAATNLNHSVDLYWRDLAQLYLSQAQQSAENPDQQSVAVSNAVTASRQAVQLSPENIANWNVQGFVYRNLIGVPGAESFAVASYEKAIELEPASPFSWTELGRIYILNSANLKDEQKQEALNAGLEKLGKALQLKPDYAPAHYLVAIAYDQQGRAEEAITKLEETRLVAPNDVGLAFQLGVIYWQRGDTVKAQGEFEKIKILDPNHANARYMLGLVYDKEKQKEKAITEFAKVLELNPDNQEVKKILDNLAAGRQALSGIVPGQPPIAETPQEIQKKK
ncbi:MAG: tetratricopeptide repeat protein [bacterium]|nr:tetratricopeptide repeat protein [bacterium]